MEWKDQPTSLAQMHMMRRRKIWQVDMDIDVLDADRRFTLLDLGRELENIVLESYVLSVDTSGTVEDVMLHQIQRNTLTTVPVVICDTRNPAQ